MSVQIRAIVRRAVEELIQESSNPTAIRKLYKVHAEKIYFVPAKYRIIGGLLQALNIKFGNFIEKLIEHIVEADRYVQSHPLSGKKTPLSFRPETDALIDQYITKRQLPDSPDLCDEGFEELLSEIIRLESDLTKPKQTITKDIDALFWDRNKQLVYVEIKYNDDHDTGKFVDINRKFLKTYAGLVNKLKIRDRKSLNPFIYYFNPTKRWGPIYTPTCNIYRGKQLFDAYFETDFSDVDRYLREIGEDEKIVELFDSMYNYVRYKL